MKKHTISLQPLGRTITVNDNTPLMDVLHEFGIEFPCGGRGTCGKCKIRLLQGDIQVTEEQRWKLERLKLPEDWRLACLSRCTENITLEIGQLDHLILADESDFQFTPAPGFGIAIDLGTTTLVAQMVSLKDGRVMAAETMMNPQGRFGSDLISRIEAALAGNQPEMCKLIRSATGNMVGKMLADQPTGSVDITIVGNTVMHHLFSNIDVAPLSVYPFHSPDLGMKEFTPEEVGWHHKQIGRIRFVPSIGSFVGSDILAGIAATGMHLKEEYTALVDLGTNGEIAVGNKNGIVCASTAAGPAFEGANISMGMRAVTGAISSFSLENNRLKAVVIGNTRPAGICGSALIDAVALLHSTGQLGMFGEIMSGEDNIRLTGHIRLTQKDIHEFLLAKAAVAAGLEILTKRLSLKMDDLQAIYIAGGFGNYINLEHVNATGMITLPPERIHKMGNTALIGAKMFLFPGAQDMVHEILHKTTHVHLESDPGFQDIYVGNMMLEQSTP